MNYRNVDIWSGFDQVVINQRLVNYKQLPLLKRFKNRANKYYNYLYVKSGLWGLKLWFIGKING